MIDRYTNYGVSSRHTPTLARSFPAPRTANACRNALRNLRLPALAIAGQRPLSIDNRILRAERLSSLAQEQNDRFRPLFSAASKVSSL